MIPTKSEVRKMHKERLESDREYVKKEVNKLIDGFFDDLKKVTNN